MPNTDIKLLRDELAKVIGILRKHERTIREQAESIAQLALERDRAVLELENLRAENNHLRALLDKRGQTIKAYDNQHTPPSRKTITQKEINAQKKAERKEKNPTGRRGRHKGHKGVSASRKADQTMRHTPDKCGSCGGCNLKVVEILPEMRTDIPPPPRVTTTCHIVETCECLDCGQTTKAKTGMIKGTSLGPNLLAEVADFWEKKGTYQGVADSLEQKYGERFSDATIQHALDAIAIGLEPEARDVWDGLKDADFLGYDETTYPIMGESGWAWVAASHDAACFHLAASRSRATFEEHVMVPGRPGTVDGYVVYDVLDIKQRCWAHILRDADAEARAVEKAGMEMTDCRDARILADRLRYLFHIAKAGPRGDQDVHDTYVRQALEISGQYATKFGEKLAKAAPDLFTFMLYDLEPTNNHSERAMRFVVGNRNVRMQVCSLRGMWRCNILWTCIRTWRLRGTSIYRELRQRMAEGTLANSC